MKRLRLAILGAIKRAVRCDSEQRPIAFDPKFSERDWRRVAATDPIRVDEALRPARKRDLDERVVLASNRRIDAIRLAEDRTELASQKTKRVEKVNCRFVDQQAFHVAEVGLRLIRLLAPAVACPH